MVNSKIYDKKNALKKIAQIFGIDVEFINEIEEKNKKKKKQKLKNIYKDISSNIETKYLEENEINGDKCLKEDDETTAGNAIN